jgi:hypothetical protein
MAIGGVLQPDIVKRLREVRSGGLVEMSWAAEAAGEIERLRSEVRELRRLKSPDAAYEQGYSDAQERIREALGITE